MCYPLNDDIMLHYIRYSKVVSKSQLSGKTLFKPVTATPIQIQSYGNFMKDILVILNLISLVKYNFGTSPCPLKKAHNVSSP